MAISCNPTTSSLDFFLPLLTQVSDDPTFFLRLDQLDGVTWEDPTVVKAIELNQRIVDAGVFQPAPPAPPATRYRRSSTPRSPPCCSTAPGARRALCRMPRPEFVKKYKVMKTPAIAARRQALDRQPGRGRAGRVGDEQEQGCGADLPEVHLRARRSTPPP